LRPWRRRYRNAANLNNPETGFLDRALARSLEPGADRTEEQNVVSYLKRFPQEASEQRIRGIRNSPVVMGLARKKVQAHVNFTPIARRERSQEGPMASRRFQDFAARTKVVDDVSSE